MKRIRKWTIALAGVSAAILALLLLQGGSAPRTEPSDPAGAGGIRSGSSSGGGQQRVRSEGRVAARSGASVVISSEVSGLVENAGVAENQDIRRGDLLLSLRSREQRAALAEARGQVAEARTAVVYFEREFQRKSKLHLDQVVTGESLDAIEHQRDAARARVETAAASVERIEAALEKTQIFAPIDGMVLERSIEPGEMVAPGAPLFRIADLTRIRIEAEVDEFDADHLAVGQPVRITSEAFSGKSWRGHIEEIPNEISGRRLRPMNPGKPQDAGVLLVKIAFDEATPLKLGQRVELDIEIGEGR